MRFDTAVLLLAASVTSATALLPKPPAAADTKLSIRQPAVAVSKRDNTQAQTQGFSSSSSSSYPSTDAIDRLSISTSNDKRKRMVRRARARMAQRDSTCTAPPSFVAKDFTTFTPAGQASNSSFVPYLTFTYVDSTSGVVGDVCDYGPESVSLTANYTGLAARWPCTSNGTTSSTTPEVAFVWQRRNGNLSLTPIEAVACASSSASSSVSSVFEVSGSIQLPALDCQPAVNGSGTTCTSSEEVTGQFSSMQPRPY